MAAAVIKINATAFVDEMNGAQSGAPTEEQAGWVNEINQIITEYMTIIHARQTRNAHSEEEKVE